MGEVVLLLEGGPARDPFTSEGGPIFGSEALGLAALELLGVDGFLPLVHSDRASHTRRVALRFHADGSGLWIEDETEEAQHYHVPVRLSSGTMGGMMDCRSPLAPGPRVPGRVLRLPRRISACPGAPSAGVGLSMPGDPQREPLTMRLRAMSRWSGTIVGSDINALLAVCAEAADALEASDWSPQDTYLATDGVVRCEGRVIEEVCRVRIDGKEGSD